MIQSSFERCGKRLCDLGRWTRQTARRHFAGTNLAQNFFQNCGVLAGFVGIHVLENYAAYLRLLAVTADTIPGQEGFLGRRGWLSLRSDTRCPDESSNHETLPAKQGKPPHLA